MTRRMAVVLVVPVLVVLVLGVYAAPGTTSAGLVGRLNSEVMLPGDQALRLVLSDIKAGRLDETRYQHLATIGEVDACGMGAAARGAGGVVPDGAPVGLCRIPRDVSRRRRDRLHLDVSEDRRECVSLTGDCLYPGGNAGSRGGEPLSHGGEVRAAASRPNICERVRPTLHYGRDIIDYPAAGGVLWIMSRPEMLSRCLTERRQSRRYGARLVIC